MTLAQNLRRSATATGWMGGSRLLGVGWRVLLVAVLGIAELGVYAVVIAAAALLVGLVDAYYVVRTPRVDAATFAADRSARWWLGAGTFAAGLPLLLVWAPAGLVAAKAGLDLAFNAHVAGQVRDGRPDLAYRAEGLRQGVAVGAAATWLLLAPGPGVESVVVVYLLGLLPFSMAGYASARRARPVAPERSARTGAILAEAAGAALYTQGDVLLLAALAGSTAAGQLSFGVLVVWLVGLTAQTLVTTYHEPLRAAGGDPAAGPPTRVVAVLALLAAGGTAAIGVVLALLDADRGLWLTFVVLAGVSATRVWSAIFATILALQHRDGLRLGLTVLGVATKAVGITVLAHDGAVGAAVAFLLADAVLTVLAAVAVWGRRGR